MLVCVCFLASFLLLRSFNFLPDHGFSFSVHPKIAKVFFVVIFGFLITLTTTSFSVLGIRRITEGNTQDTIPKSSPVDAVPQAKKPTFSSSTLTTLISFATLSSIVSLVSSIIGLNSSIPKIAKTLLMLSSTLASFVFGARLPPKVTKVVHPLVTCTSITWIVTKLLSLTTKTQFVDQLRLYRTGKLASLTTTGAGDILLFMLGPSVVALACQMYNRRTIMRKNIKEVATAVIVGSTAGGLFGTALLVRLVNLASSTITLSLLPRNITSPLAMAIATLLGGADVSLAVSMVVVSGLLGANFGASILDKVGIHDPVARGLGIGAAAHGLGTAAFANEPDAFPFSAIAMALTASLSTVLVSVPLIRRTLIKIALGH
jgi:putative effector of murein hydrolase